MQSAPIEGITDHSNPNRTGAVVLVTGDFGSRREWNMISSGQKVERIGWEKLSRAERDAILDLRYLNHIMFPVLRFCPGIHKENRFLFIGMSPDLLKKKLKFPKGGRRW